MKILITGGTGYVGKKLISYFSDNSNFDLFVIVRKPVDFSVNVKTVNDDEHLEENIAAIKPDVVIHLASYLTANSGINDINNLIDANILFGTRLLNALKNVNLKCFINVGTFAEYHLGDGELNPTYLYAATKTAFRSVLKYYAELSKIKVIHVIPYTIYGGKDSKKKIIDYLFDAIDSPEPLKMSAGLQYLDFIHINDVVDFFLQLTTNFSKIEHNEVLHLGTGKPNNLREVVAQIEELTGKRLNILWGANPPRERDTIYACAPTAKLSGLLNWQAKISIKEGLHLKYSNKNDN